MLPIRRPLGLNRERYCNRYVYKIKVEFIAILKINVFIFSFYLDSRSLLRRTIGREYILLPRSIAKLAFSTLDLFSFLDNWLLLRGVTLVGNSSNIIIGGA